MSAALIVVDMQNGFVHPEGSVARLGLEMVDREAVIAETAALLAEARRFELPIVYTRHLHRPDYLDAPALVKEQIAVVEGLLAGTWDAEIIDDLAAEPGDVIVDKNRYDASLYTDMEVVLRALGVTSVLVTGCATNVCVESTARAADMRDFRVSVASDCTTTQAAFHENALHAMAGLRLNVAPWRELLPDLVSGGLLAAAG
jgi:ureidoacrylate peracid hydrolase